MSVVKGSLEGVTLKKSERNVYVSLGFGSHQGYDASSWGNVSRELQAWCDANNARHRQSGWLLLTHGTLDHQIGAYAGSKGAQVAFLHPSKSWMPLISKQWPQHASAGAFLPSEALSQGRIADEIASMRIDGDSLEDYIGGVFVAGGDPHCLTDAKSLKLNQAGRTADIYVAAKDKGGAQSPCDARYGPNNADPMALSKATPLSRPSGLDSLPGPGKSLPGIGGGTRGGLLGQLPGLGKPPADPFAKAREDNLSPLEGEEAKAKESKKEEKAEEVVDVPDSPSSIVSEEALEYDEDDFEGDDSLNSGDITIDGAEESVEEVSMGLNSMSPLSAGWNVEDQSASASMIDKMGHVEDVVAPK